MTDKEKIEILELENAKLKKVNQELIECIKDLLEYALEDVKRKWGEINGEELIKIHMKTMNATK